MTGREFLSFDINEITTITEKHEPPMFEFKNPNRPIDGFVLFTEGEAEFLMKGQDAITVKRGDFIIFRQGDKYSFFAKNACSYITCGLYLDIKSGASAKSLPRIIKCSDEQMDKIYALCEQWTLGRPESRMACKVGLMAFYLDIFKLSTQIELSDFDHTISLALDFIHLNFKRNFKTEEIARYCSLSPSYLRWRFSESLGMTITEYRDRLRIKAAKELLTGGLFTVKETAAELGFCDVYHFSKFFAKYALTTPAKYAKETINPR